MFLSQLSILSIIIHLFRYCLVTIMVIVMCNEIKIFRLKQVIKEEYETVSGWHNDIMLLLL